MSTPQTALHELREALRAPIPTVDDFTFQLSSVLDVLGVQAGRKGISVSGKDVGGAVRAIDRSLGSIQQALLVSAVPTFLHALDERGRQLLDSFFCPLAASSDEVSTHIALCTYQTLSASLSVRAGLPPLPVESRSYVLDLASRLARTFSLESVYSAVWGTRGCDAESSKDASNRQLQWEEAVRALVSLPAKVGNAMGRWRTEGWNGDASVQAKPYFDRVIVDLEALIFTEQGLKGSADRLRLVVERLAAIGLLVPKPSKLPHSPAFFPAFLPRLLIRFQSPESAFKDGYLAELFLSLPNSVLDPLIDSLLSHLVLRLDAGPSLEPDIPDSRIRIAIHVLSQIIGPVKVNGEAWDAVVASVNSRKVMAQPMDGAEQARNRVIAGWVAQAGEKPLVAFADMLLDRWTDAKWIRFSSFSTHCHLTHLLLLTLGRLRPYHPFLITTSTSGRFLMACQSYLAHPDGSVRRTGMLVAESLSAMTVPDTGDDANDDDETEELMKGLDLEAGKAPKVKGPKRLQFGGGMWEGHGEGREEARWLRKCMRVEDDKAELPPAHSPYWLLGWGANESPTETEQPTPRGRTPISSGRLPSPKATKATKEKKKVRPVVMLDDDPMSGYSSPSASSSRSPSPSPSYLEEVASDPTLALESTEKKKVQRPVYVPQLLGLLRDKDNPDALEMALNHGEALIRAKRTFGTEVSENAVNLVSQLVGMNDPYKLDDFEKRRDALSRAVVACAPKQTAPYLAEQYFTNQYSLQQRSVMLTAMAMAARELAGLHVPEPAPHARRIDFPSKTLPIALHQQYISPAYQTPRLANRPMNQIDMVSDEIRGILLGKGAKRAEEEVPEIARQKRLRVAPRETGLTRQPAQPQAKPVVPFAEVAAEYFVLPLVNGFWQHYQDTAAREARAVAAGSNYRGAGAGMVLSPIALERFLLTLALLVHAARHASVYLSVVVPETLELAVTVGSKHFTRPDDYMVEEQDHDGSKAEGQVVAAALELALVCLDGAVEMDQGRTLATDKPELVLAAGEWAQGVFEVESRGGKVAQGQGSEGKIKAAAAGVVVKVAEMAEKWTKVGMIMRQ